MHNMVAANGDSHFDDMDKPVMFSHILHRRLLLGAICFGAGSHSTRTVWTVFTTDFT